MAVIRIMLPTQPASLTAKVIPQVINWLAEEHGLEATLHKSTFSNKRVSEKTGVEEFRMMEVVRPSDWDEDDVKKFSESVGLYVMEKICEDRSE